MLRTHTCGELTEKHIGQDVTLYGWVDTIRDHGKLTFVDLRDRYGRTQLVLPERKGLRSEDCIQVKGKVQHRPEGTVNTKIPTGVIEVGVQEVSQVNPSADLPFEVTKSLETNEDLRMKYRYLDLRNPEVQKNLFARHRVYQIIRRNFDRHGFIEVETPILTKSTPEGARDYLVPSRVNQGEFYALPQSPQLFKQILMVSGFDKYFQIAKCFRDEDLRADRQPEFTQLDIEMSFLDETDLFGVVEETLRDIWKEVGGFEVPAFGRLTYQEAMAKYGSDKPDLRFGLEIKDLSDEVRSSGFKVFTDTLAKKDGAVLAIVVPKPEASRKDIDTMTEFVKQEGAGGLAYFKVVGADGMSAQKAGAHAGAPLQIEAPIAKFFKPEELTAILKKTGASEGDLILFAVDERKKAQKTLGALRLYISKWKGYVKPGTFHFAWVMDFPLFQWNEDEKRWDSEHHPFTAPDMEDWNKHKPTGELGKIRSRAYDLVLNGNEIASGSVRIHRQDMQNEIFKAIGLSDEEIQNRFGFLLKAFSFGAPPHGGMALGIDRVLTILLGLDSIREVIAFPKNQKAVDQMVDAPSPVNERQLRDLGIKHR